MARRVAYLIFLLPVIISVPIAAYVLMDILEKPDRRLDLWPIDTDDGHNLSVDFVQLYTISFDYVSDNIQIQTDFNSTVVVN